MSAGVGRTSAQQRHSRLTLRADNIVVCIVVVDYDLRYRIARPNNNPASWVVIVWVVRIAVVSIRPCTQQIRVRSVELMVFVCAMSAGTFHAGITCSVACQACFLV